MSKASKFDFTAWLETKNPDEIYNFSDSCGRCLMGQYMTAKGEEWSMPRYNDYVQDVLAGKTDVLSAYPQTMGSALTRVKVLEDA